MDSFAGLDGLSAKKKAPKSLEEQRREAEAKRANTWASLDLLGSSPASVTTSRSTSVSAAGTRSSTPVASVDPFDPLAGFASAPQPSGPAVQTPSSAAPAPRPAAPAPRLGSQATTLAPETASGGSSSASDAPIPPVRPAKQVPAGRSQRYDFDDEFTEFQAPTTAPRDSYGNDALPSRREYETSRTRSVRPHAQRTRPSTVNDRSIAQLVDMGFEADISQEALVAMDGSVSGAVTWIMAKAQGRPLPQPRRARGSDDLAEFGQMASQIGASVFAKASSLWSKGRKEIAKAYEEYAGGDSRSGWRADTSFSEPAAPRYGGYGPGGFTPGQYTTGESRKPSEFDSNATTRAPPGRTARSQTAPPRDPKAQTPVESASSFKSDDAMPARPKKSRAELFRQMQQQKRQSPAQAPTPPPTREHPDVVEPSSQVQTDSTISEGIDLLNLGGATPVPTPTLGGAAADILSTSRQAGTDAFARGDYPTAVNSFTEALAAAPSNHPVRVVLLANRAAAHLKTGDPKAAFDDSGAGLTLLATQGGSKATIEPGKNAGDLWSKLVARRAQAAENMERFSEALECYKQLLDGGYASATNLEGKRRCQAALQPKPEPVETEAPRSKRRGWGTATAGPTTSSGKAAIDKVKNEHKAQALEERERDQLRDQVIRRVDAWRTGKESNLRALLASLHEVLWANSGWQPVSVSELVVPKKVRLAYMKAVARTHPDKVPSSAPLEHRMVAESVFITIQHAWEAFRTENGM